MAKTHTSSEVKRRYNEKVYSKLSFQLPKDLVAEFKERCKQDGISQASVVKAAIEQYLNK
ncbi:MAG: CopG family transcriptional regulator [Eubacterium sp.]|nr:CopG family transcriptional regulator [Eubacterium sp.]